MANSNRVYDQIMNKADYYGPDVYKSLLTYMSSLELRNDDRSNDFIPISQTSPNTKMFVVGIIPPAVNVSGRLLDRSATIFSKQGNPQPIDPRKVGASPGSSTEIPDGPKITPSTDFYQNYVCMCNRLGVQADELAQVLMGESGFRTGTSPNGAKGLNQLVHETALGIGMTETQWSNYQNLSNTDQLYWVQKFFDSKPTKIAGLTAPDIAAVNFGNANKNANGSLYDSHSPDPKQQQAYRENSRLDLEKKGYITPADLARGILKPLDANLQAALDGARTALGMSNSGGPQPNLAAPPGWLSAGSKSASDARQSNSVTADKNLNLTDLGQKLSMAQQAEIYSTVLALENMKNTPPLRFLVNPTSFKVSSEKIISDGNWTRNGPIVEHWGDGQDKIDFSGKVAAFMAIDGAQPTADGGGIGGGLSRVSRNYSASFQNFLSLYLLYRSNAALYLTNIDSAKANKGQTVNRLSMLGSIYIFYDGILYIGSFDNFNVTEQDDKPFSLDYSIQFTVRAAFLLDQPLDPKESYGPQAAQFFATQNQMDTADAQRQAAEDAQNQALKAEAQKAADLNAKKLADTAATLANDQALGLNGPPPSPEPKKVAAAPGPPKPSIPFTSGPPPVAPWGPIAPPPGPPGLPEGTKVPGGTVGPDGHTVFNAEGVAVRDV